MGAKSVGQRKLAGPDLVLAVALETGFRQVLWHRLAA